MGWFQRLFGGVGRESARSTGPIVTAIVPGKLSEPLASALGSQSEPIVTAIVPGKLLARVYAHDFADGNRAIPCWTYVTEGFYPLGQKEFVFTLARGFDDPAKAPSDPLQWFTQIFSLAEQKQLVDVGGYSCFQTSSAGFLGLMGMIGFAYTRPEMLPGIAMPPMDQCLSAVLLVPGEVEWVKRYGAYRVLTRLGRAAQYFPHPPWSDPNRGAVVASNEFILQGKMLQGKKVQCAQLTGASLRKFGPLRMLPERMQPRAGENEKFGVFGSRGDPITLRVPRDSLAILRDLVVTIASEPEAALVFLLEADPESNGQLVWRAGDHTTCINAGAVGNDCCLTGGFLCLVFGPGIPETDTGAGWVVEDGFLMLLGPESWLRLSRALTSGEPGCVRGNVSDQIRLSVEWIDGPATNLGAASRNGYFSANFL